LNWLRKTLARNKTLDTASLDSLVLLLGELGQPIGGCSQIITDHRPPGHDLVCDCLLDELVLADAQPGSNFSG
jgi:hypothetical protein